MMAPNPHLLPNGQIEPKLGGRHWGVMEIQNCLNHFVMISTMAHSSHLEFSIASSPKALLQVSLCHGLLTVVRPSFVCPSETFHIFDISIRIVSMMTPAGSATLFRGDLIMKYFLRSFSSFLQKRHLSVSGKLMCAQYWLNT